MIKCFLCGSLKEKSAYSNNQRKYKIACDECDAERRRRYTAAYRAKNKELLRQKAMAYKAANAQAVSEYNRKYRYTLLPSDYKALLDRQGGKCAICRKPGRLSVDHDHSCCPGKRACGECIRGLLCSPCNKAIGFLNESRENFLRAVSYLGDHD